MHYVNSNVQPDGYPSRFPRSMGNLEILKIGFGRHGKVVEIYKIIKSNGILCSEYYFFLDEL